MASNDLGEEEQLPIQTQIAYEEYISRKTRERWLFWLSITTIAILYIFAMGVVCRAISFHTNNYGNYTLGWILPLVIASAFATPTIVLIYLIKHIYKKIDNKNQEQNEESITELRDIASAIKNLASILKQNP